MARPRFSTVMLGAFAAFALILAVVGVYGEMRISSRRALTTPASEWRSAPKLTRAAGRRGISADVLIKEAIERAVDYDDSVNREVEKGLAQIDAGRY
jgi:hypothetical protein